MKKGRAKVASLQINNDKKRKCANLGFQATCLQLVSYSPVLKQGVIGILSESTFSKTPSLKHSSCEP